VDLDYSGGVLGIFGPSGSGKSSLFRALAGLGRPQRGWIGLDETMLLHTDSGLWIPPHKRGVGMVFQEERLFPHWSVRKNLQAGMSRRERSAFSLESSDVVEQLELEVFLHRRVDALSGGEQRRVAIARALLANPRLLLLDEPFTGLNHALRAKLTDFLIRLRDERQLSMILISHNLCDLRDLTRDLAVMQRGRILHCGPLSEVPKNPAAGAILGNNLDLREWGGLNKASGATGVGPMHVAINHYVMDHRTPNEYAPSTIRRKEN
jgi:molybdate transport system ATP-binding protein